MRWFGPASWGAPICRETEQGPLPLRPCVRCERPFEDHEEGLLIPAMEGGETPYHLNCFLVAVGALTVHVLRYGRALCDFSLKVPGEWPTGHAWVRQEEWPKATCRECRRLSEVLVA
jgi:hypothetical protein